MIIIIKGNHHQQNPSVSHVFRCQIDDDDIQDEMFEVTLMDQDTIGNDKMIGLVYVDLMPLVKPFGPSTINGWFPIYDTLHGVRGDLQITMKLEAFRDENRFRDTSIGVQFFSMLSLPECYSTHRILGFVEELIVNSDPEYHVCS